VVDPKRMIRKNGEPRRRRGTRGRWHPHPHPHPTKRYIVFIICNLRKNQISFVSSKYLINKQINKRFLMFNGLPLKRKLNWNFNAISFSKVCLIICYCAFRP
jgi:hypothetical protein